MSKKPTHTDVMRTTVATEQHRFSDQEAAEILKRAAELQCDQPALQRSKLSSGFSLVDLEHAAHESGMNPTWVRQAALELRSTSNPVKFSKWVGAPTTILIERWIDGEISETAYPEIVAELCRTFGDPGTSSILGNALTWTPSPLIYNQRRSLHVMITPQRGQTAIRIQENLSPLAGRIFGGILGGVGGGGVGLVVPLTALLRIPAMIPLAALLWIGCVYQFSRKLFRSQVAKYDQAHQLLFERLANAFAEKSSTSGSRTPSGLSSGDNTGLD